MLETIVSKVEPTSSVYLINIIISYLSVVSRWFGDLLTITTKRIDLHCIGYSNPWEITNEIFVIKRTDDQVPTFETIGSNEEIIYISSIYI